MRTLIVHYLPRKKQSQTLKILETFKKEIKGEVKELDLNIEIPELFNSESLNAYFTRNYKNKQITSKQKKYLENMDHMTRQVQTADIIVLAYPMFNFSVPAAIKAWMDSILQKGQTWDIGPKGYIGLMQDKKALIITTSGGIYDNEHSIIREYSTSLATTIFSFMEFDEIEIIKAEGLNQYPKKADKIVKEAQKDAELIAKDWY